MSDDFKIDGYTIEAPTTQYVVNLPAYLTERRIVTIAMPARQVWSVRRWCGNMILRCGFWLVGCEGSVVQQ